MNMEQWWNDIFAGETEVLGENLPSATLSTTNPTWIDLGTNPGLRGERPATNRLSHGTALFLKLLNAIAEKQFCLTSIFYSTAQIGFSMLQHTQSHYTQNPPQPHAAVSEGNDLVITWNSLHRLIGRYQVT
jgi:hypothetical protein